VSEITIRKVWAKQEVIRKHSALMSEETKGKNRASVCRFTELEDKLHLYIDSMCQANLSIPLSLTILNAIQIAE